MERTVMVAALVETKMPRAMKSATVNATPSAARVRRPDRDEARPRPQIIIMFLFMPEGPHVPFSIELTFALQSPCRESQLPTQSHYGSGWARADQIDVER